MLNLQDFTRLLVMPIGALSGLGSARDMQAGVLAIVLFTVGGLFLGVGVSWLSFKFERRFFVRGRHPFGYMFSPLIWIFAAWLTPALFALILLRHE
jgi:hypothetical protein